jgi:hypothetical protein
VKAEIPGDTALPRRRSGPYFFIGPRPFREARIRGYLVRQHHAGRTLEEILEDAYIARCGGRELAWRVVCQPETIAALGADVLAELEACRSLLAQKPSPPDSHAEP